MAQNASNAIEYCIMFAVSMSEGCRWNRHVIIRHRKCSVTVRSSGRLLTRLLFSWTKCAGTTKGCTDAVWISGIPPLRVSGTTCPLSVSDNFCSSPNRLNILHGIVMIGLWYRFLCNHLCTRCTKHPCFAVRSDQKCRVRVRLCQATVTHASLGLFFNGNCLWHFRFIFSPTPSHKIIFLVLNRTLCKSNTNQILYNGLNSTRNLQ